MGASVVAGVALVAALSVAGADAAAGAPADAGNVGGGLVPVNVVAEVVHWPSDAPGTLKTAQREARVKALARAVASRAEPHPLLRHEAMLRDIAVGAKGVIVDERWGELVRSGDGSTATLALTAKVNVADLERAVCTVARMNHDPKVALVVVERAGPGARWRNDGAIGAALSAAFTEACFTVVARSPVTEVSAQGEPSPLELKQIVRGSSAQYVIVAAADVVSVAEKGAPVAWRATLRARAINTAVDGVEAASTTTTVVHGGTAADALSRAREHVVPELRNHLMESLVRRWFDGPVTSGRVHVRVEGQGKDASDAILAVMKKALGERCQIALSSDEAALTYDVVVDGGAETFANAVEAKPIGDQFIEVIEVSRGRVILKLSAVRP